MKPNYETGNFEFDDGDKAALRLPSDYDSWPFDRAVDLLDMCQKLTRNTINIGVYPLGEHRNHASQRQAYYHQKLAQIIDQLHEGEYLPSVAEGAEDFLQSI